MSETDDSIFMTEDDYCEDREERLRAEITKLKSQLEEARAALRKITEAKMPGEARSIARSVLDAHKEGGKS